MQKHRKASFILLPELGPCHSRLECRKTLSLARLRFLLKRWTSDGPWTTFRSATLVSITYCRKQNFRNDLAYGKCICTLISRQNVIRNTHKALLWEAIGLQRGALRSIGLVILPPLVIWQLAAVCMNVVARLRSN